MRRTSGGSAARAASPGRVARPDPRSGRAVPRAPARALIASDASLRWLLSFADPALGVGWNPRASRAARWRLGRTRALLDLAGAPDHELRCVLVAGTKGKGSTAAFLASVLHRAGVRAGLFTSPHLQAFRERVRIDGALLRPRAFARAIDELRPLLAALRRHHPAAGEPTTFELTLLLALRAFAARRCAVAVLEVGLGGALDATNAVEPAISIVSSISYDHTAILGRSLGAIAREKAGVLRPGRPALLAPQRPVARRALRAACRERGARCLAVAPVPARVPLGLAGAHQRTNAALAAAAARGLGIGERPIRAGLRHARWPGRFEVVTARPPIVLDGAHNGASAEALARELGRRYPRGVALVVGINRDKDAQAVLRPLLARARHVVATSAQVPRALAAAELAARCGRLTSAPVEVATHVGAALRQARATGDPVCVTGSLALVGEARTALGLGPPERLWPALAARE